MHESGSSYLMGGNLSEYPSGNFCQTLLRTKRQISYVGREFATFSENKVRCGEYAPSPQEGEKSKELFARRETFMLEPETKA